MNIRIPFNKYFNDNFKKAISEFFELSLPEDRFKEINFFYLFNHPWVKEKKNRDGKVIIESIRINEDLGKYRWDRNFLQVINQKVSQAVFDLEKSGYCVNNLNLTLSWRMVVGLGASHPQETSMTLHHIYGIPYIPGSAVKGVTKHYCVQIFAEKYAEENSKDIEDAIKEVASYLENEKKIEPEIEKIEIENIKLSELRDIFGTQNKSGEVIFFDAYPVGDINLKMDIMNPHYPEYYSEGKTPADWQNPVPIKFLTVEDTTFQFDLASRDKQLCDKAFFLLKKALTNYGIGAKTMLGYGIFKE